MITRILVFVSAVVVGMSALNADEAINKAYHFWWSDFREWLPG